MFVGGKYMYQSLEECVLDLEKHGHLVRIKEEVDPYLEMASIQRRAYKEGAPAILFENVKGSRYPAVANLFGSIERSKFMFRHNWDKVQDIIALRDDPMKAIKSPFRHIGNGVSALTALPMRKSGLNGSKLEEIELTDIPFIQSWPDDGGRLLRSHKSIQKTLTRKASCRLM